MVDYVVGDTVRRVTGSYKGMGVGDTGIVLSLGYDSVCIKGFGDGHSPEAFKKCIPVFDAEVAAELRAEALAAVARYNAHLALYEPPFKPLVLE